MNEGSFKSAPVFRIDEPRFELSETHLRSLLNTAANKYSKKRFVQQIRSYFGGSSSSLLITIATVPKSSFMAVGAMDKNLVYDVCFGILVVSIIIVVLTQITLRIFFSDDIVSTDEAIGRLLNPKSPMNPGISTEASRVPGMFLRAFDPTQMIVSDPIDQQIFPQKHSQNRAERDGFSLSEASNDKDYSSGQASAPAKRVEVSVNMDLPTLSEIENNVLRYIAGRGMIPEKNVSQMFKDVSIDIVLSHFLASGLILISDDQVIITNEGMNLFKR